MRLAKQAVGFDNVKVLIDTSVSELLKTMRSVDAACIALYCLMHVGVVVLISRFVANVTTQLRLTEKKG